MGVSPEDHAHPLFVPHYAEMAQEHAMPQGPAPGVTPVVADEAAGEGPNSQGMTAHGTPTLTFGGFRVLLPVIFG